MLGIDYASLGDTTLSIEYSQSYLPDNPERDSRRPPTELLARVEQPNFALRFTRDFMRQTLRAIVVITTLGVTEFRGMVGRTELSYELSEGVWGGLGYATYQPYGDLGPLLGFDRHDQLSVTLRWDFQLI